MIGIKQNIKTVKYENIDLSEYMYPIYPNCSESFLNKAIFALITIIAEMKIFNLFNFISIINLIKNKY